MSKKVIILVGGRGKMGSNFAKILSKKYHIIIFDKLNENKVSNYIQVDLSKKIDQKKLIINKKFKNIVAIINLVRDSNININDPSHYFTFFNYSKFLENLITINKIKNCNVINISSINVKLISQQSYGYHFSKLNLELFTKYFSVKYLKKNIFFNDIRVGLVNTKNIEKILRKRNLKNIIKLNKMLNYKKLIDHIENIYIKNSILTGTCLTIDNSFSNFDQIYFHNLAKK